MDEVVTGGTRLLQRTRGVLNNIGDDRDVDVDDDGWAVETRGMWNGLMGGRGRVNFAACS